MVKVDETRLPFKLGGLPVNLLDYDHYIQRYKETLKIAEAADWQVGMITTWLWSMHCSSRDATFGAWAVGHFDVAKHWAQVNFDVIDRVLFGDWRDQVPSGNYGDQPPNRAWWDKASAWKSYFESALLWCSSLREWDRLERIAGYLRDDVSIDFDQSNENRAWLLLVAGVVRGRDYSELDQFSQTVLEGKKTRERLLLWTLDAILEEASEEASDQLGEYAKRYLKLELPKHDITTKIALDASFLVHWAAHCDVDLRVPEKLRPHIVSFDDKNSA